MDKKKIYLLIFGILCLLILVSIHSCSHEEDKFIDSNSSIKDESSTVIDNHETFPNESEQLSQENDQTIHIQNNDSLSTPINPLNQNTTLEGEHGSEDYNSNTSQNKPAINENESSSNNNDSQHKNYWNILFNEVKKANSAFEYLLNLTEEALN
ncbi:hypothetical protein [Turicibacter sanguinis]|uniref:hypothetical protein n=1 Tax=Turicibacter sanguinis TaxID=154288 RepID=UPI00189D2062|nr:hypothetical protein [Turicibacter sanguinis]MDB8545757.1 hypothetical protein [Turicibacter sanguinis]